MELEEIQPNAVLRGIVHDALVTVIAVKWFGSSAVEITYKTAAGKVSQGILYRESEPQLEIVEAGRPWKLRW